MNVTSSEAQDDRVDSSDRGDGKDSRSGPGERNRIRTGPESGVPAPGAGLTPTLERGVVVRQPEKVKLFTLEALSGVTRTQSKDCFSGLPVDPFLM